MSQGTPNNALAGTWPLLLRKEESTQKEWADIIAELGKHLRLNVLPNITLKKLRQQLWIKHDQYLFELDRGDKVRLVGSDQDVYEEQGLFVAKELAKTDAGAYVLHFLGILRNGCWVRGFITFDPVIYKGLDFTFDTQESGILFVERVGVAQILACPEWQPIRVIKRLINEASNLVRDREDRMMQLRADFQPIQQLEHILRLKYGPF